MTLRFLYAFLKRLSAASSIQLYRPSFSSVLFCVHSATMSVWVNKLIFTTFRNRLPSAQSEIVVLKRQYGKPYATITRPQFRTRKKGQTARQDNTWKKSEQQEKRFRPSEGRVKFNHWKIHYTDSVFLPGTVADSKTDWRENKSGKAPDIWKIFTKAMRPGEARAGRRTAGKIIIGRC